MIRKFASLCLLLLSLAAAPVRANPLQDALDVRILPGWRSADGQHVAALQVKLSEGWKTYWRAPGDAGIPPQFDWRGSRNLAGVEITWPTPKQFLQDGVLTIGYADQLILPLKIMPKRVGKSVHLAGQLDFGVCKDVCVPVTLPLSQELPSGQNKPDPRIVAALAERPYSAAEAGVGRVACHISPTQDGVLVRAEVDLPSTGRHELAVMETDNPQVWAAQTETRRAGGRLIAETRLFHIEGRSFAVKRSGLRITVLGDSHAVDIQGCPAD